MADRLPQSYANHRQIVPGFHVVTLGLLAVLLIWALVRLVLDFSAATLFQLLLVLAVALVAWYTRMFPLKAQDRIIRLETQLRLARVLPPELAARVPELSTGQLIALRFAADDELPELTRRCLAGELRRRDDIKRQVRSWVADYERM